MIYGGVVSIKDDFNQKVPLNPPTEVAENTVSQQKAKSFHKAEKCGSNICNGNASHSTV